MQEISPVDIINRIRTENPWWHEEHSIASIHKDLNPRQKVMWAVKVKWSDRYFDRPEELKSLVEFCHANKVNHALVTTRVKRGTCNLAGIKLVFVPASIYSYTVGYNLIYKKHKLQVPEFLAVDTREE